jgi:hypothetical protein
MEDTIANNILSNFDFSYMLVVNVLTYLIIKNIYSWRKDKDIHFWYKRLILVLVIVIVGTVYYLCNFNNTIELVNSSILAPIFWSWIFKPVAKKIGIDYKDANKFLN